MPESEMFGQLVDFGALGIFAVFLIWQHLQMQKRLDRMVQAFQEQLREIEAKHERRVEAMRLRYDDVIDRVRADGAASVETCLNSRDLLVNRLGEDISEHTRQLSATLQKQDLSISKIDEALVELRACRDRVLREPR